MIKISSIPLWLKIVILAVIIVLLISGYKRMRPKIVFPTKTYTIELALTDKERKQGLSNRTSLHPDHGMLFVFPSAEHYSFWMKDVLFPLDFIWIKDGVIVDITANVPIEKGPQFTLYRPSSPSTMIVELNAGEAAKNRIEIGQTVTFKFR